MAELLVGEGGEFPTLTAAIAAAEPGDTVRVLPGVYGEFVRITTANLTIVGEPGAVLDGGYSHEWAKTSGSGWRDLRYKAPPTNSRDMVVVAADGVTVAGLRIRNAPASGIGAGAVNGLTVRNCSFDHLYSTGIKINGTTGVARNILIEGNYVNAASVRIFDRSRTHSDPQGVSGAIKVGNAADVVIRGNVVVNGFGEGINLDKGLKGFVAEGNVVVDCNHKLFYCNGAADGLIQNNVALNTGHPAHLWTKGQASAGFALNDETEKYAPSDNLTWENNLAINCGVPLQIIPRGNGRMIVESNTFIWGPLTRKVEIKKAAQVKVRGNIFAVTPDGPMPTVANTAKLDAGPNLWTRKPPAKWGNAANVIADPLFVNPVLPGGPHDAFGIIDYVTARLDLSGFDLRPDSPAVRDGGVVFGATVRGELPEEPEPPVEPVPEPEPIDPVPALVEARAQGEAVLVETRAEYGRALASVASLERQIESVVMMLGQLDELIALLDDE